MAKKGKNTLQELTELEFFKLEAEEKYAKYEKEISRYKKTIANLKRKDRLFTKAISLCETKITNNKESSMNSLLFLCENIKEIKSHFFNNVAKLNSREQVYFESFEKELDYIMSSIYKVCNKIEENSVFTKDDREVISSRFEMSDLAEVDQSEGFAKLTEVFKQNLLKRNHKKLDSNGNPVPEKPMEECIDDFGEDDERVVYNEEYYNEQLKVQNAFNKMFYEAPTSGTKVTSNIDNNGVFDFNEALNPTLSLSDIMNDLMGDGEDDDDEDFDFGFPPPSTTPKTQKPAQTPQNQAAKPKTTQNNQAAVGKTTATIAANSAGSKPAQTQTLAQKPNNQTNSSNPASSASSLGSNQQPQASQTANKPAAPKTAMSKQAAKLNSIAMQNSNLIQPKKEKTFAELGFDDEDDEPEDDYIYNSNFSINLVTFDDEDEDFDDDFDELDEEERENEEFIKNKQSQMEKIENKMAQNSKIERRVLDEPKKTASNKDNGDYEKKFTFIQNLFKKNKN